MHGGTNFGFMNGANILGFGGLEVPPVYVPDVTRYICIIRPTKYYCWETTCRLSLSSAKDPVNFDAEPHPGSALEKTNPD